VAKYKRGCKMVNEPGTDRPFVKDGENFRGTLMRRFRLRSGDFVWKIVALFEDERLAERVCRVLNRKKPKRKKRGL